LFILGTALMTALARAYTWDPSALDSRHLTASMLFPVLVVNMYLTGGTERKPLALPGTIVLGMMALAILPGWRAGISRSAAWSAGQRGQVAVLKAYRTVPDDTLYANFIVTGSVRANLSILEKMRYNIFR